MFSEPSRRMGKINSMGVLICQMLYPCFLSVLVPIMQDARILQFLQNRKNN